MSDTNLTTTTDNAYLDAFASYGRAASTGAKSFLSFKKGFFYIGKDTQVKAGTRIAVDMSELRVGYIKWLNSKPVENRMAAIAKGERPPTRSELGDDDKTRWETDDKGEARDPWALTNEVPVYPEGTEGVEWLLTCSNSKGAIGAIGNLCKDYAAMGRQRPGMWPIVELVSDSYVHTKYGPTHVPVFRIVSWIDNPTDVGSGRAEPAPQIAAEPKKATRF